MIMMLLVLVFKGRSMLKLILSLVIKLAISYNCHLQNDMVHGSFPFIAMRECTNCVVIDKPYVPLSIKNRGDKRMMQASTFLLGSIGRS